MSAVDSTTSYRQPIDQHLSEDEQSNGNQNESCSTLSPPSVGDPESGEEVRLKDSTTQPAAGSQPIVFSENDDSSGSSHDKTNTNHRPEEILQNEIAGATPSPENLQLANFERIRATKLQLLRMPTKRKLGFIAPYFHCESGTEDDLCPCIGWRSPRPRKNLPPLKAVCKCGHLLIHHVSSLRSRTVDDLNRTVSLVVDTDNMCTALLSETNAKRRRIFLYLHRLFRRSIIDNTAPDITNTAWANGGGFRFDEPCIQKALENLFQQKYRHLPRPQHHRMHQILQHFLFILNTWEYPMPNKRQKHIETPGQLLQYEVEYSRWQFMCFMPIFCSSLKRYTTTMVCGRRMLQTIFVYAKNKILQQCEIEIEAARAQIAAANRPDEATETLSFWETYPEFLKMLEPHVFSRNSTIWRQPPPPSDVLLRKRMNGHSSNGIDQNGFHENGDDHV